MTTLKRRFPVLVLLATLRVHSTAMASALVFLSDFGTEDTAVAAMKGVAYGVSAELKAFDLTHEIPAFNVWEGAYRLKQAMPYWPAGTVFVCVVDPGVGSARSPMLLHADGQVFVGPGNGLFEIIARRSTAFEAWEITWRPERLSPSFHGRDLFAPAAAAHARGDGVAMAPMADSAWRQPDWPDDLAQVIYLDHFGNAITGLRAAGLADDGQIRAGGEILAGARTFSEVPVGQAFWYENANGLVEIAINQGSAAQQLDLIQGSPVTLL